MADITVAYHSDGYGPARPAVNVKVHAWGSAFRSAAVDAAFDEDDADDIHERAQERVYSDFWQAATENAESRGLGRITQEGRSGGWLVFEDGYDPEDDYDYDPESDSELARSAERRIAWLRQYAAFAAWCDAEVAAAPARVARLAQDMAIDDLGERTVNLPAIFYALKGSAR